MEKKIDWKMVVISILLVLSLTMSILSPILYFAIDPNKQEEVEAGSGWTVNEGSPDNADGKIGDFYLDSLTGTVYQKQDSGWVSVYTFEPGEQGERGSTWRYGKGQPQVLESDRAGDFYLDQDSADIYHFEGGQWKEFGNIAGKPGKDGSTVKTGNGNPNTASVAGENGDLYLDLDTFNLYEKIEGTWESRGKIKGDDGTPGTPGEPGEPGEPGQDGTDTYMGYDGYIWNGAERTSWHLPSATVGEDVFDHTLEITGVMSKYFEGDYINLSDNMVALMSHYQENANLTLFSFMEITEITVYAKDEGNLYIGKAKVSDVVDAKTNGTELNVTGGKSYPVQKGQTTITLTKPLEVADGETVVLGGHGSAEIYYAKNIPLNDEMGNFTLLNNSPSEEIISKTGGKYQDTLAIQVKVKLARELPIFENLRHNIDVDLGGLSSMKDATGVEDFAAFVYNQTGLFAGKTITKIGVPVRKLEDVGGKTYLDLYLINAYIGQDQSAGTPLEERKKTTLLDETRIDPPLQFDDPADMAQANQDLIDNGDEGCGWVDFDCNIEVGDDQTLAFCGSGHGVDWLWLPNSTAEQFQLEARKGEYDKFLFLCMVGKEGYHGKTEKNYMFFDVYYSIPWTLEEQLGYLEASEYEAQRIAALKNALSGKYISILGDSISTYEGYSNEYETQNSDIKSNGLAYPYYEGNKQQYFVDTKNMYEQGENADIKEKLGVVTVDETWWMSTINKTGMKLCVNNSSAGDGITFESANKRAKQLSDNTYDDEKNPDQHEEIFPDIIAIYMGINDFNSSSNIEPTTFKEKYQQLISEIQQAYQKATIFVFTLLPSTWGESTWCKDTGNYYVHLENFNQQIRDLASETDGVEVVDLYNSCGITKDNISTYSTDGIHPNKFGMEKIANCFISALYNKYVGDLN